MLHILLLILKIIGMILLVLLCAVLCLIGIVLLVPFRYRVNASVDGQIDSLKAEAKVSWFFRLIYAYAVYENQTFKWNLRVFWKRFDAEKADGEPTLVEDEAEEPAAAVSEDEKSEERESVDEVKQPTKKRTVFEKIKYTFRQICDKIKALVRKKEQLQKFLTDEIHRSAWARLIRELARLWKYSKPKKLKLDLKFGFEDPSVTGKVLAVLSMIYPFYVNGITIEPDFENQIMEGTGFMKGRIYNLHLLIVLLNLIFDKNVKHTYKAINNWGK